MNRLLLLLTLGFGPLGLVTMLRAAAADLIWHDGKVVTVDELCAVRAAIAVNVLGYDDKLGSRQADRLAAPPVRQSYVNGKRVETRDQGERRSRDAGAT